MFIVWGKKLVYRKLGYVADFCPICHEPRAFELRRVGSASHVYYISAGEGKLVGYERKCKECGTSLAAQATTYASVSKTPASLSELKSRTFPNLDQVLQERLALEDRIRNNPASLSSEERHALIKNPFLLLSPKVEKRFASTHLDKEVGLSLVAAVALLIVGPAIARAVAPGAEGSFALALILLGVLLVAWQIAMSGRRFMRRQVVPVLAKALRPLKPSEREIQSVMAELKQLKHKIGSKLNAVDLMSQLSDGSTGAV